VRRAWIAPPLLLVLLLAAPGCRAQEAMPARFVGPVQFVPAAADGDVSTLVNDARTAAERDRRRLLVYVGATWCEPCLAFHEAAARGELDAVFPGLTLLEFDADRDGERLKAAGYTSQLIPLFARPAADGRSSGVQTEGAMKGKDWVADITPRLQQLLTSN
jgi:hypothetical protein